MSVAVQKVDSYSKGVEKKYVEETLQSLAKQVQLMDQKVIIKVESKIESCYSIKKREVEQFCSFIRQDNYNNQS